MIEKIELHIDTKGYKNKKFAKKDINIIKNRTQNAKPVIVTIDQLIQAIQSGKSFSPAVMKGLKANDFIQQQLFAVDIDNKNKNAPILQIQDALKICSQNNLPVLFYYPSFSHTKDKPRYRLVFMLDKVISDRNERNTIANNLCHLFEQADKSCTNADRIFYGTNKNAVKCDTENQVKTETILSLLPPKTKNKDFTIQDTFKNNVSELDELKQKFDFLSYLEKRNGGIKTVGSDYVMFNTCEVCGHNEDLAYYRDTNTFKCFSDNGGQSGSIIDYLMITENLELSQAIHKFKNELCQLDSNLYSNKTIKSMTAKELINADLKAPYIIVENMLCQGFTILAGAPKVR